MSQFDYISNAANGYGAQDVLHNLLWELRKSDDLSIVVKNYRAGDPSAVNAEQFYAPFMIQFNDGLRWIIFSTTSRRTDRIKGQQWDADNLKRLDSSIEKAVLTYPDDIKDSDKTEFVKQKQKYDKGLEISRIDDIVSNSELVKQIRQKAQDVFNERQAREGERQHAILCKRIVAEAGNSLATKEGRSYDFNGRAFERDVASMLNNETYLEMLKKGVDASVGNDKIYGYFVMLMRKFAIAPSQIDHINATSKAEEIGLLPSGGQPKTDVWARVFLLSGEQKDITISCKRTACSHVSVHQYTADAFANVLDSKDSELRKMLRVFQFYANARDMSQTDKDALTDLLRPHLHKLCKWVLGGFGAECTSSIQCADYLVIYQPPDGYFAIHTIDEYIALLLDKRPLAFGTPFGWTYASGQRQMSIQLKVPIIRD